jgi:hypothetical protein
MNCEAFEIELSDFLDNQLTAVQRSQMEQHLAVCANCRALAAQLQHLDAALSSQIRIPLLSPSFDRDLKERIKAGPVVLTEFQKAERKSQLEAEYEAGLKKIAQPLFAMDSLLQHLGRAVLAAIAGWLAWQLTAMLVPHASTAAQGPLGNAIDLLPWLAASIVFLFVGLAEGFSRQWDLLRNW